MIVRITTTLALLLTWCTVASAAEKVHGSSSGPHSEEVRLVLIDALRFAKQAESAGAAGDQATFIEQADQASTLVRQAAERESSHRITESLHAVNEASAQARDGKLADGREDMQSAIVWLSRATGLPVVSPSAGWSARDRGQPISRKENRMSYVLTDIEEATRKNEAFRKVLFTAENSQLVLMSLKPGEDIGLETHDLDQFIRVEAGHGTARLDGRDYPIQDGSALVIPAGTKHNVINTDKEESLKLYTIYSPPEHKDGTVHHTKAEALADQEDHFDGKTTAMLQESTTHR